MTDKTEQEWIAIIKNSITLPAYQNMPITIDQGTVRYLNLYGLSGLHLSYQKGYVESSISINLNASGNLPSIQTSGNTGVNVELEGDLTLSSVRGANASGSATVAPIPGGVNIDSQGNVSVLLNIPGSASPVNVQLKGDQYGQLSGIAEIDSKVYFLTFEGRAVPKAGGGYEAAGLSVSAGRQAGFDTPVLKITVAAGLRGEIESHPDTILIKNLIDPQGLPGGGYLGVVEETQAQSAYNAMKSAFPGLATSLDDYTRLVRFYYEKGGMGDSVFKAMAQAVKDIVGDKTDVLSSSPSSTTINQYISGEIAQKGSGFNGNTIVPNIIEVGGQSIPDYLTGNSSYDPKPDSFEKILNDFIKQHPGPFPQGEQRAATDSPAGWTSDVTTNWQMVISNQPPLPPSPLVLDIDGQGGVELTALKGTGAAPVYFDMDNDGFREATGWVTGGDGLLCIDTNANGAIDGKAELFGDTPAAANGFVALDAYHAANDNGRKDLRLAA